MRIFSRIIAVLTAVVFVVTAVAALFVVNLVQVTTNRRNLKESVRAASTAVVDEAPVLLAEMARLQAQEQGIDLPPFNEAAVAEAIRLLLPPEWVEIQAVGTVDALFFALESGDPAAAELTVAVAPVLENLRGEAGLTAVATLFVSLPECSAEIAPANPASGLLPSCLPPGTTRAQLVAETHTMLVETVDANPQLLPQKDITVPLFAAEATPEVRQARDNFVVFSRWFRLAQRWGWLLWLLPGACLLLIGLLAVRSGRGLGLWWGWPMVLAGIAALLLVLLLPVGAAALWGTAVVQPEPTRATLALTDVLGTMLQELTALWRTRVVWQAGGMFVAGGLLLLAALVARPIQSG